MARKGRKRKRSCIEHTPVSKRLKKYPQWSEEQGSGKRREEERERETSAREGNETSSTSEK